MKLKSAQMDLILQLLYNADAAAEQYSEALSDDLVFDLRKLISFIEEDQSHAHQVEDTND